MKPSFDYDSWDGYTVFHYDHIFNGMGHGRSTFHRYYITAWWDKMTSPGYSIILKRFNCL